MEEIDLGPVPESCTCPDGDFRHCHGQVRSLELEKQELQNRIDEALRQNDCFNEGEHHIARSRMVKALTKERPPSPLICSVCKGPREPAAWSGICGNCQDLGYKRKDEPKTQHQHGYGCGHCDCVGECKCLFGG